MDSGGTGFVESGTAHSMTKKWGTMSTDPLRSERVRIIARVSTLELYSIRFRIAYSGKRRGESIS